MGISESPALGKCMGCGRFVFEMQEEIRSCFLVVNSKQSQPVKMGCWCSANAGTASSKARSCDGRSSRMKAATPNPKIQIQKIQFLIKKPRRKLAIQEVPTAAEQYPLPRGRAIPMVQTQQLVVQKGARPFPHTLVALLWGKAFAEPTAEGTQTSAEQGLMWQPGASCSTASLQRGGIRPRGRLSPVFQPGSLLKGDTSASSGIIKR